MSDNPFDENGYYIDRAMRQKDPPVHRIKEDAHRIYAQKMEAVQEEMNKTEITVLHAEDTGDDPYEPPIDCSLIVLSRLEILAGRYPRYKTKQSVTERYIHYCSP